jgi:hypothetical protein
VRAWCALHALYRIYFLDPTDCAKETNDHALLCPAPSRQRWRTKCITTVINYTERTLHSDPVLCDILRDGLSRWAAQIPTPNINAYPEQYRELIQSQNFIGWDHLFRARWSKQWGVLHSSYAQRVGLEPKRASGSAWVRKVGRNILQQWFDLWKIRNSERHGQDVIEQKAIRKTFLKSQLDELYALRDATMPIDRHMFLTDTTTHLTLQPNLDNVEI